MANELSFVGTILIITLYNWNTHRSIITDASNPKCNPTTEECYWYSTVEVSHADSQTKCASDGGVLTILDTSAKFDFVVSFLPTGQVNC